MIFALAERSQDRARVAGHWDPRDPHALPTAPTDPDTRARQKLRGNAIAEIAVNLLTLSWWLDSHTPAMPELQIQLTPVWHSAALAHCRASHGVHGRGSRECGSALVVSPAA